LADLGFADVFSSFWKKNSKISIKDMLRVAIFQSTHLFHHLIQKNDILIW
jgi:hypothetical protein